MLQARETRHSVPHGSHPSAHTFPPPVWQAEGRARDHLEERGWVCAPWNCQSADHTSTVSVCRGHAGSAPRPCRPAGMGVPGWKGQLTASPAAKLGHPHTDTSRASLGATLTAGPHHRLHPICGGTRWGPGTSITEAADLQSRARTETRSSSPRSPSRCHGAVVQRPTMP